MQQLMVTSEGKFIISCLSSELMQEQIVWNAPHNLDWDKFGGLLEQNRLAAHFSTLAQKHSGGLPDSLRDRLKQARYALLLYGDQNRAQIRKVLQAFDANQIEVIVMKGWALIQTLYAGDHGQRFCEDIDILVTPEDTDRAEAVLLGLGYAGMDEVTPGYTRRFTNARAYKLPGKNMAGSSRFSIGLHWGLTHYPYFDEKRIHIPDIIARAHALQVAGVEALEMAVEDQIVYTCAHLSLHHRNQETLLNYFEIAAVIQRAGNQMDWQKVIGLARNWGYLVQLQNTLAQVNALWPQVIPESAMHQIYAEKASWQERWIDHLVGQTKSNAFHSALVEFLAMPGFSNKISSAGHQLFPDKAYMLVRYGGQAQDSLARLYWKRLMGVVRGLFARKSDNSNAN